MLMIAAGVGALGWAERHRATYATTANAASGVGIVTLYLAFYAAHALYGLVPTGVTFVLMGLVTVTAAATAVRYDARYTAILGVVGGLATPVLLSTGADRQVGLFTYLTLLNAGFLFVARRQRWHEVAVLSLVGTTAIEAAWLGLRVSPDNVLAGAVGIAALGALYVRVALDAARDREPLTRVAGLVGGLLPLAFAIRMAADASLEPAWPVVLGNVAVLALALTAIGLRWATPPLVLAAAVAASVALVAWTDHAGPASPVWGPALVAIGLVAALEALHRNAPIGLVPMGALILFTWYLVEQTSLPLTAFLLLVTTTLVLLAVRAVPAHLSGAFAAASTALAFVTGRWFWVAATPETYAGRIVLPHLAAVVVSSIVVWRRTASTRGASTWDEEAGVCGAVVMAVSVLFGCAASSDFARPDLLYGLLGLDLVLVLLVVLRARWFPLVGVAAAVTVAFVYAWEIWNGGRTDAPPVFRYHLALYAAFVALPFLMTWSGRPASRSALTPWATAALVGPAFFPPFYGAWVDAFGKAWVGAVPLLLAAVSVGALCGVSRAFDARRDDVTPARRLGFLALFAAIALGFVATAIPLQLDRQWITIGWALEAAAVWWLFGRLPHPGLKYFGLLLYLAVGLRLLANPEVLRYEPRGRPIVNWLLYTYGVPALCCFAGALLLPKAEARRGDAPAHDVVGGDRRWMAPLVGMLGLLIAFWLINLEIADYFSIGRYVEVDFSRQLARDLTRSCAWGLYALTLLGLGLWRRQRGLRIVSLGFLLLTVGKVFLYDLGQLTGLYRIVSFLALGLSLMLVSLLYQRFVRSGEARA
jgi:uncharacterized membrane protein